MNTLNPRLAKLLFLFAIFLGCGGAPRPPQMKGDSFLVLRDLLEKGTAERPGYGAYSYVLVPRDPASDERYVTLLDAYMVLPKDRPSDDNGTSVPLSQRNLTYVPVEQEAPPEGDKEWLRKNYDVARAAMLLRSQCLNGKGPYVVTTTKPLSMERSQNCDPAQTRHAVDIAVLDLSDAPNESISAWFNYFIRVSQEPDDWRRRKAERMLLKLHDLLTALGHGASFTVEAIEPAGKLMKAVKLSN